MLFFYIILPVYIWYSLIGSTCMYIRQADSFHLYVVKENAKTVDLERRGDIV